MRVQDLCVLHRCMNIVAWATVVLITVCAGSAQVESTLVRFDGVNDGGAPYGPLLADSAQIFTARPLGMECWIKVAMVSTAVAPIAELCSDFLRRNK